MALRSALVNVMAQAAKKAARGLLRDFGEVEQLQVSRKGPADFVTNADIKAEKILRQELSKARPSWGLLMEETGEIKGKDEQHRWVVDPLDGTLNFLHGIPHFAITIAAETEGEPAAGIVYDPVRDELFWAVKGQGAYVNERRIRVSGRERLHEAVLATCLPRPGDAERQQRAQAEVAAVMPEVAEIRRFGSASLDLAYTAAGRFDGYWEWNLKRWDISAGVLIMREAGGIVSDLDGGASVLKTGHVLAANDKLHAPLKKLLADARRQTG
ncbi:MAG TPA: inositol monophosphatase family protein [Stellaceae bacterium]|nr:inositol monophosphatase family protein [Stellaceae bacterium]